MFFFDDYDDDVACVGESGKMLTETTLVYRIEMPDGHGPFNGGPAQYHSQIMDHLHNDGCDRLAMDNHEQMGVTEQSFIDAHGACLYGCDSVKSIKAWFAEKDREWLHKKWQAKLYEFELEAGAYMLTVGNGEVIFSKQSKKVRELDMITCEPISG